MHNKYCESKKKDIVQQYLHGQRVKLLQVKYNIPRSTIYSWMKKYKKLKSTGHSSISYQDYYNLKRRADKLEEMISVIKQAGCGLAAPLKEKLAAIESLYGQYSVHVLCEAMGVSRGTFYNHILRRKKVTEYDKRREEIREMVVVIFNESKQSFGAKKICAVLAERGVRTTSGYVAELMSDMDLQSVVRHSKRAYRKQIERSKRQNVLQQQFDVAEPNRVWVSDTTCFKVKGKFYYICAIMDLFSRKIVAHRISSRHSTYLITSTFRQAFEKRGYPQQLTFHSDQGTQYTSKAFRDLLHLNKVVQSFSRPGKPHDNAVAEAFFSLLKKEELYRTNFRSEKEFCLGVDSYINFYNTERPHGKLANRTPERFEMQYQAKEDRIV